MVCIFIHDWGYWGKPNLDGPEGSLHPMLGESIAYYLFGYDYSMLCAGHSRTYAQFMDIPPSRLCWADKLSFLFEPRWFYLLRANLSGEMKEISEGVYDVKYSEYKSQEEWFTATRKYFKKQIPESIIPKSRKLHEL